MQVSASLKIRGHVLNVLHERTVSRTECSYVPAAEFLCINVFMSENIFFRKLSRALCQCLFNIPIQYIRFIFGTLFHRAGHSKEWPLGVDKVLRVEPSVVWLVVRLIDLSETLPVKESCLSYNGLPHKDSWEEHTTAEKCSFMIQNNVDTKVDSQHISNLPALWFLTFNSLELWSLWYWSFTPFMLWWTEEPVDSLWENTYYLKVYLLWTCRYIKDGQNTKMKLLGRKSLTTEQKATNLLLHEFAPDT